MKVTWIGEQRELPLFGIFQAGDAIDLPEDIAQDLIRQGLVKEDPADAPGSKKKGA